MFDTDKTQERGQVGIGTLIVFIALVLVAAIAAGVLINTAGFLQSQAEATGQESTDQVSNNIQLVSASGNGDFGDQQVEDVTATLQLAPGSDPVRLEELDGDGNFDELAVEVEVFGADLAAEEDDGTFDTDLLEEGETVTLTFGADVGESDLDAGDEAEVVITTEDGSQTTFLLVAPDPVEDDSSIRLG